MLKQSAPIWVFFLIGYILVDSRTPLASGKTITGYGYHWMALAQTTFGLTWLPAFQPIGGYGLCCAVSWLSV